MEHNKINNASHPTNILSPPIQTNASGTQILSEDQMQQIVHGMQVSHRLGHYQLVRELGQGNMGRVFLARDTRTQQPVALKIILESGWGDKGREDRFLREIE